MTAAAPVDDAGHSIMIVECRHCGLRHAAAEMPAGHAALCRRCGALLLPRAAASREVSLALSLTGLILAVIANLMPLMSIRIEGRVEVASLASGALALAVGGLWPLAALIILTTIVVPLARLGSTSYVLLLLSRPNPPPHARTLFRWLERWRPWAMIEVYLLGVFVAYVKLGDIATIEIGAALYALAALMLVMATLDVTLDAEAIWKALAPGIESGGAGKLARCDACALVSVEAGGHSRCPRCGAALHARKEESLSRCWALVIAALIFYLPANYLPVMTVISFGNGAPDTILSGVEHLIVSGMWPLALLVFFASITVPVLKLVSLLLLLVTTQRGSRWRIHERTLLYRIVEGIGRWSMIDIFMLSVLVALVRLGAIASVEPGAGALAFAAVVVVTMLAASAFDPRLMWDSAGENP
jgi:paraquat-inducible protein A